MSDPTRDPIDDRLRGALRGLPLPDAPETLRRALESIPERATVERPSARRWSPGLAIAAVVLVAVVGAAGLLGLTRTPATPGTVPPPAPTAPPAVNSTPRPMPSGTPQPRSIGWFTSVALSADGRTVTLDFTGGKPYDPGNPCSKAYEGWAQVAGDTLYAAVVDVTEEVPLVEGAGCTMEGYGRTVEVTLPEPFTGNRVQDLAGSVQFLRAPIGLAVLTTLAETWHLESEGNVEGSPNGRWARTYTLEGAQEPGPGRLDLYQAFGAREIITGGDEVRTVSVNGRTAILYRDAQAGELVLVWSLGTDGLAIMANEADFTAEALIRLAEGARIGP